MEDREFAAAQGALQLAEQAALPVMAVQAAVI
jgi:hypothetical protein